MKTETKKSVVKAINTFATPETLTTKALRYLCLSDYTIESIRSLIIDPVKSKIVPTIKAGSLNDYRTLLFTIFFMFPEKIGKDIFKFDISDGTAIEDLKAEFNEDPMMCYYNLIYGGSPDYTAENGGKTVVVWYKGAAVYIEFIKDVTNYNFSLELSVVGPNAFNVCNEIRDMRNQLEHFIEVDSKAGDTRKILVASSSNRGGFRTKGTTVPTTIIVDHVQEDLDEILNMIQRSENLEEDYKINKTVGILLHGPHGTGKSTIARYLALMTNRTLILATSDNLSEAMDYIQSNSSYHRKNQEKFILLIEDIDFMFTDRRKKGKRGENDDEDTQANNDEMNRRTSLLFQVLDGVLSDNNLIVVATTNYYDRLDPALIRDGRFDHKIEMRGLDHETAIKVCEKFDVNPDDINLSTWKTPISPATLQSVLLKFKVTNRNTYDPNRVDDTEGEN